MPELEDRLRAAVGRQSEAYEPAADLPERIAARVRHHRRRRQVLAGGLVSAAAAALTIGALVAVDRGDDDSIRMTDDDQGDVTTVPSTTSTSTSTSTVPSGPGQGLDERASPTRQGIGPITAGMTLREAEEVAGITLTPTPVGGGSCLEAPLGAADDGVVLVVEAASAGPDVMMNGVVRAVVGSVLPSVEGAMVGQSRAEVLASLGQPTRVEPGPPDLGGEILVFEEGGFAYGVFVLDDLVLGLQSGDPAWVTNPDGCP
jgi:hypothetical protein